ncbi:uncharacterized protein UMAG_00336 [Mycosarcoma maydis]|uniref:Uncharacterized protein n=1 Tax=Mycosarcoma maydis TaxID=5270 RepID=A0A0D1CFY2_MYCMD|nr:uncharacterized protein UMAG_00336 [Ustilago maydis 521]KIS71907.1 hypothetical protein UMAG_00336 [Ustilago maydis 521]|eukprot:XP_011386235.1 hypothetical protein UMAG_00336 [Ustilago maydis 521]
MCASQDNHHVVHIGGAQFVPPVMTHFAHVSNLAGALSSPISESSSCSSRVHSRFSSSSTSASCESEPESLQEWDALQAHVAYARRMADHTAHMWQRERLAIEKAKLQGTYTGNITSRQNGNARPPTHHDSKSSSPSNTHSKHSHKLKPFAGLLNALFSPSNHSPPPRSRSSRRSV